VTGYTVVLQVRVVHVGSSGLRGSFTGYAGVSLGVGVMVPNMYGSMQEVT
jgi:hypothetical protein